MKLELLRSEFEAGDLKSFTNLNSIKLCDGSVTDLFINWIDQLRADFELRFEDFGSILQLMKFAKYPADSTIDNMLAISIKLATSKQSLQNQLNEYKSETLLVTDDTIKY